MHRPRTIIWIFTAACNLDCLHCYTYRFRGLEELSIDRKIKLIDEFYEIGVEHVGLSGGEPFVHKHTVEILRKLGNYGFEISMVTNGTVLNSDVLELVKKYNVFLYVSLDGPREVHEKIRGLNTFDKVMMFLDVLRSRGIEFGTVMALNKLNYRYVKQYIDIAMRYGASEIAFIPVMPVGKALINKIYIDSDELVQALQTIDGYGKELGVTFSLWCTPFAVSLGLSNVYAHSCRTVDVVDIDPAGRLLLCDTIDIPLSSVESKDLQQALEEYYSNSILRRVIEANDSPCKACPFFSFCRAGCFSRSYALFKDLNAGDPLCPHIAKRSAAPRYSQRS